MVILLTHRHIDEIVDWLTQRGVTVSLNSNAILVPKKLNTIQKLSVLKISLDGPPDSHDAMRGTGSFEKALAGATAARDAAVKVEFTCTVRAGPDRLKRIPRRLSGLLPGLVPCNLARGA